MMTVKPYDMTFTEFAEAIRPGGGVMLANPLKRLSDDPEWLTSVWNSADNRATYYVVWLNASLKNELPPDAREYRFDDLSLHSFTKKLGLDPNSQDDNGKAAKLLAIRNAWITAIQHHYGQSATGIPQYTLTNIATHEYLLLTSGLFHPWMQEKVRRHIEEQDQKSLERADKTKFLVEMSSNPNWPDTPVISIRSNTKSPLEEAEHQAAREERMKDIRYWLEKFKSDEGNWTSKFEIYACDAQGDINIANQKITALQKIIGKQEALIISSKRIIESYKRHDAVMRKSKKIGRPEKSPERQEVALIFTSQWVQSLMDALNIKTCAQLEARIDGSNQRNWRRWLNRETVPSHNNLSELLKVEITQGSYKGKPLHDVPTNPEHNNLLALISLT
jgi:hypothetical protein